jgi:hypothetical protein
VFLSQVHIIRRKGPGQTATRKLIDVLGDNQMGIHIPQAILTRLRAGSCRKELKGQSRVLQNRLWLLTAKFNDGK